MHLIVCLVLCCTVSFLQALRPLSHVNVPSVLAWLANLIFNCVVGLWNQRRCLHVNFMGLCEYFHASKVQGGSGALPEILDLLTTAYSGPWNGKISIIFFTSHGPALGPLNYSVLVQRPLGSTHKKCCARASHNFLLLKVGLVWKHFHWPCEKLTWVFTNIFSIPYK